MDQMIRRSSGPIQLLWDLGHLRRNQNSSTWMQTGMESSTDPWVAGVLTTSYVAVINHLTKTNSGREGGFGFGSQFQGDFSPSEGGRAMAEAMAAGTCDGDFSHVVGHEALKVNQMQK